MSLGTSLGAFLRVMIRKLFKMIGKLLKALLPYILIGAVLYFAGPAIGSWLSGMGAPGLGAFFSTTLPGLIGAIPGMIWGAITSAWGWFTSLGVGGMLAVVGAVGALLAPDEFTELVTDVIATVGDGVGTVVGGVLTGIFGDNWLLYGVAGFALWLIFFRDKKEEDEQFVVGYADETHNPPESDDSSISYDEEVQPFDFEAEDNGFGSYFEEGAVA